MTRLHRFSGLEPHVFRIATVVVLGIIMSVLDTTIVNVALHDLATDFHSPLDDIQWVATGYMLALAAMIPLTGWAARRLGSKRLYMIALVVFTVSSALCAFAWSTGSLVGFRVLQGIGGGMLTPVGQMILVRAAGPKNIARVMAAIGIPIILAPVFGPTLGGLLLDHVGWEAIFLINVPIGALALFAAMRMLEPDEPEDAGKLDAIGLGLVGVGVVAITYGLAESGHTGSLASPEVLLPVLGGLVLVGLFVMRALRISYPLLDVRLFADKGFASAALTTFALGAALFGAMILMPLYFQTVRGESAVISGLLLAPQGVGAGIAMHYSARATERLGAGLTAAIGTLITIVTTIPFAFLGPETSYFTTSGAMVLRGLGIGLSMMPAMTAAFAGLKPSKINDATPQLTVLQRVGGSMGTAVLTVILQNHLNNNAQTPTGAADAFGSTYWWVLGITALAIVPTIVLMRNERRNKALRAAEETIPADVLVEAAA